MLLHVRIRILEVAASFGVVDEFAVDIVVGTFFISRHVQNIFPSLRKGMFRKERPVYISAISRKIEKLTSAVVAKDIDCSKTIKPERETHRVTNGNTTEIRIICTSCFRNGHASYRIEAPNEGQSTIHRR